MEEEKPPASEPLTSCLPITRRGLLKSGLAAASLAAAGPLLPAAAQAVDAMPRGGQTAALPPLPPVERRQSLDAGWRFHLGNADEAADDFAFGRDQSTFAKATGAGRVTRANFDDSAWSELELPHDWAVDLPFHQDPALTDHGSKPLGRAYPATSIGWYRRRLRLGPESAGRRLTIEFDGVFRNAMVFLNGEYLGVNFSGYAPFRCDITDLARIPAAGAAPGDGDNLLAVRVDATLGEGWFYEGAGIYRHVWLTQTHPVHLDPSTTAIRSTVRGRAAAVTVASSIHNQSGAPVACRVVTALHDADGRLVATARSGPVTVPAFADAEVTASATVAAPRLWSLEAPHLYQAVSTIEAAGSVTDSIAIPFGIRTIRFDPDRGFFLNDKPVKIQGTCNHQDHAGVGAALPDRLQAYRVERLLSMGSNAYRTSHNPPTPELLDACDRLGMLVMDETRMMSSTPEGLGQLERLVRRDRNHPSVILWSLGNEEPQQGSPIGSDVVASMKRLVRRLDPTRPVTVAMNGGWGRGVSAVVDVQGFNYGNGGGSALTGPHIDAFHRQFPRQPSIGSETASAVSTRGIYANDKVRGYVSAYDVNYPSYALNAEGWWKIFADRPFLTGGFAWTGFDYRGEPSPYGWPCISSHFGIMDTCGFPKDSYYYYRAWWQKQPVLHLFPHWNWEGQEGQPISVWCHTNVARVELFLNGRSLGARNVEPNGHLEWSVPYAPGVLEARGGGLVSRRETAGAPARIALTADRPQLAPAAPDLAVVNVAILDPQGRPVPTAANLVRFALDGPARILGVGNGDPSSHEPDHASQRTTFNGLAMALVATRSDPGAITLHAESDGLAPASLRLR